MSNKKAMPKTLQVHVDDPTNYKAYDIGLRGTWDLRLTRIEWISGAFAAAYNWLIDSEQLNLIAGTQRQPMFTAHPNDPILDHLDVLFERVNCSAGLRLRTVRHNGAAPTFTSMILTFEYDDQLPRGVEPFGHGNLAAAVGKAVR